MWKKFKPVCLNNTEPYDTSFCYFYNFYFKTVLLCCSLMHFMVLIHSFILMFKKNPLYPNVEHTCWNCSSPFFFFSCPPALAISCWQSPTCKIHVRRKYEVMPDSFTWCKGWECHCMVHCPLRYSYEWAEQKHSRFGTPHSIRATPVHLQPGPSAGNQTKLEDSFQN